MEAEDQKFCELMDVINCSTFHMNNEEARPIIDNFLIEHPELLEIYNKEWYYKYC